jgi:Protein of unknown function (DUF2865)
MSPAASRVLRSSLAVSVAAYAIGLCLASSVIALATYRVATSVLSSFQTSRGSTKNEGIGVRSETSAASLVSSHEAPETAPNSSAARKTLPRIAQGYGRPYSYWGERNYHYRYEVPEGEGDYDDEDRGKWSGGYRRSGGAYRTLCVRLCDGYYFPISYSVSRDRLEHDAQSCERACPGQARLFVHATSAEVDDMVDLGGKRYRELKTAFLYRTEQVPSCKCKPDPWEPEARQQHRMYALEAAARKGDANAKTELAELTAKMKRERASQDTASASKGKAPASVADAPLGDASRRRSNADDTTERMGLGRRGEPRERSAPSGRREADWIARVLGLW